MVIDIGELRILIFSLFSCFFIFPSISFCQDISIDDPNVEDSVQSEYYHSYEDFNNIRTFLSSRRLAFNLKERFSESPHVDYAPNSRGFIGFGAFIFDLGIEVGVKLPKLFESNTERYGETKFIDVQSYIYGRKWNFDLTFQQYKGFYISNPWRLDEEWEEEDAFPLRGDMEATNAVANVIYLFNTEKFSYRAAFNQTEKQLKSAGSLLLLSSLSFFRMEGDSTLLYIGPNNDVSNAASLRDGRLYTWSFLPGYSYNLVWKHFLLNMTASAGYGVQYQSYKLMLGSKYDWRLEPKMNLRAALTYDNDKFFTGAFIIFSHSRTKVENLQINPSNYNFRIFTGYRFKKSGIFKKYSIKDILDPLKEKLFGKPSKK